MVTIKRQIKQIDVYGCKINELGRAIDCRIDVTFDDNDGRLGLNDVETYALRRLDVSKAIKK